LFLEFTDDSCVKKLSGEDGSQVFDIDLDAGWRMYDIAVNPDNGDFYVYYGMDVNRYSKDGELLKVFDEVTMNTPWEKLECALTGDNRLLWIVDVDYNLICFDALTGEYVADGPEGWDVQPGPGTTVWAYCRENDDIAIRQINASGKSVYEVSKSGRIIRGFAVNPSDYSLWVRYDDHSFTHYDTTGNAIGSFTYELSGSEDIWLRFYIEGNNGNLLVGFLDFYVFSPNGDLLYKKLYPHCLGFCYGAYYDNWYGIVAEEDWDFRLTKFRSEDGMTEWEVDTTDYFEGIIPAAK
jgi:hypothetical protein